MVPLSLFCLLLSLHSLEVLVEVHVILFHCVGVYHGFELQEKLGDEKRGRCFWLMGVCLVSDVHVDVQEAGSFQDEEKVGLVGSFRYWHLRSLMVGDVQIRFAQIPMLW